MRRIDEILSVATERLVIVKASGLLIDAARLLNGPQFNLVVVCDDSGRMTGVISKTDVVDVFNSRVPALIKPNAEERLAICARVA